MENRRKLRVDRNNREASVKKVMFVRCDWRISIHFVGFCIFCGRSFVAVIMIDGSKIHKSLAGVEVQSPYVIERRSKILRVF